MRDIFSIEGKTALVTGGSRGIGEMIAGGFLAHGAKVYISSRKADACEATAARLVDEFGGECISLPGDVGNMAGVTALASELGPARAGSTSWSTTPGRPGAPRWTSSPNRAGTR